ncbi:replication protein VP4 [Microviridae Fen685_11]|uniref:replication protein VP4 n=1 Tax=Microviridae Fen685_11 TaxID=1655657 RepID=UPI00063D5AF8|nr:replication protein VP4 [Microviridae Fen685_11]AKI26927.1 replication protein VP4 [Microviridae Fen685_11]
MCSTPYIAHGNPVPCGNCPQCLVRRTQSWAFRIEQQLLVSTTVIWMRLSYDTAHVPITANKHMNLSKRDCQLFIKRLRAAHYDAGKRQAKAKHMPNEVLFDYTVPIKYLLCGEYGSRKHRPHYHVTLLNADIQLVEQCWRDKRGYPIGEIWFDDRPFTTGCVAYTLGYMFKRFGRSFGSSDDRQKEFHLFSSQLGLNYLSSAIRRYHLDDLERCYVTLDGGVKLSMPRYYRDKLFKATGHYVPRALVDPATGEVKQVNCLFICPVSQLWADLVKRDRSLLMPDVHLKAYTSSRQRYFDAFGTYDGYFRAQEEARKAAVRNFRNRSKARVDHE